MLVAARTVGTIPATIAGLLLATVGASPFIEAFTLSGELLASLPAVLSLAAFLVYLRRGAAVWLVVCGLLTGCAVMIKQSGFDGGLAAVLFLLLTRRRAGLLPGAAIIASAAVPVALGALAAPDFHDWWYAMVTYRGQGDSLFSGPLQHRFYLLGTSLPIVARALPLMLALAVYGWSRAPLLARLWLAAALVGVIGGGNFHSHYYIQITAPLAVLAGVGGARLLETRQRVVLIACAGLAAGALAVTVPQWFRGPGGQAQAVFRDKHLAHDAAVVDYVRAHTSPGQRIFVMWAAADIYYLADRDPAVRYMWYRNIQSVPGALREAQDALRGPRRPALVIRVHPPGMLDKSGTSGRLLARDYRLVATVEGVPIYAPR
jgi:4-amino-4-deoxy-L-arabinose transferase-like glycosyltransferase